MYRFLISFVSFFLILGVGFSLNTIPLTCEYSVNSCEPGFYNVFKTSDFLNAAVQDPQFSSGISYPYNLCCSTQDPINNLVFSYESKTNNNSVCGDGVEVLYSTDQTNARVAKEYVQNYHSYALCADFQATEGVMNIIWDDQDYIPLGYNCLFKVSDEVNGEVSSCNATFSGSEKYKYTIWAILLESIDSLNCNQNCVSNIDNRVYSTCSLKLNACEAVPFQCDGALFGSWVNYDDTTEVKCSAPWNEFRSKVFTDQGLKVEVKDSDKLGKCNNLVKIEKPTILYGSQVVMNIYICED